MILRNTPEPSSLRFLWLDLPSGELRWSSDAKNTQNFKRVALSHIQSVSRIAYKSYFGFQLGTRNHSIRFLAGSHKEREEWLEALLNVLKYSEHSFVKRRALSEVNGIKDEDQVIKTLIETINNYTDTLNIRIEDLPQILENLLANQQENVSQAKDQLDSLPSSEVDALKRQIHETQNSLAERESKHAAYKELEINKHHNNKLQDKLDRLQAEYSKLKQDLELYSNDLKAISNSSWPVHVKVKGGELEDKIMTVKEDRIILRPSYGFEPDKDEVMFKSVSFISANGIQMTIHRPKMPVYIFAEQSEALKIIDESFEKFKNAQRKPSEKEICSSLRSECDLLEIQLSYQDFSFRNYKKTEYICSMNQMTAQQAIYAAEISSLAEISQASVSDLTEASANYLRTERPLLLKSLMDLNASTL